MDTWTPPVFKGTLVVVMKKAQVLSSAFHTHFILLVCIIEPGKVRPIANDSLLCCAEQLTIDLIALQGADPAISAVHIFCQQQWMPSCAKRRRFHPAALRLWRQGG